jgi:hypothetical protein
VGEEQRREIVVKKEKDIDKEIKVKVSKKKVIVKEV